MGKSETTVQGINSGATKIIRSLYHGDFPIRKETRRGYTLKPVETISG